MKTIRLSVAAMGILLASTVILGFAPATSAKVAGGCPSYNGISSAAIDLPSTNPSYALSVSYSQSGSLFKYSVTTPSGPGSFGIIEMCVYPTSGGTPSGTIPGGTTQTTPLSIWGADQDSTKGYVFAGRITGTDLIYYNGATTEALDVTWGTVPPGFLIVLHIQDATICGGTTDKPSTCFVIPNGTPNFPPPPPPSVPQFPIGMALLFAILVPALLVLRKQTLSFKRLGN